MIIKLQPYSSKPIYEQLILEIKRGIVAKELVPKEAMPSVRTLASDIGINMHTVNKVYKRLQNEQVLVKQKSGFVVNPKPIKPNPEILAKMSEKVYELMLDKTLYNLSDKDILALMKSVNFVKAGD